MAKKEEELNVTDENQTENTVVADEIVTEESTSENTQKIDEKETVTTESEAADVVDSKDNDAEKATVKEDETDKSKTAKTVKADKKAKVKKEKKERKPLPTVSQFYESIQGNIPALIVTFFVSLFIMVMACLAVFFANSKGAEKVLVPNVVGKKWDEALLEMQVKELYPKINLRYSNTAGDEGTILEQSPAAGAIVKGYSQVSLVISRGILVDQVGDYVGGNLDELKMSLQSLFAGQTKPLIVLAEPEYKPDISDAGTILEQDPPAGTKISQPVTVNLIVSRGPNYENTRRPYVIGQSINDFLQIIARSKIVFEITAHEAADGEKAGTVVSQQQIEDEYIPNYSRVTVEMAMPKSNAETSYGVFQVKVPEYPYPMAMRLEAVPTEGNAYTVLNFNHPGGNVTVPYAVPKGTTLVLYIADKVNARVLVD